MPMIREGRSYCTVIVTVDAEVGVMADLEAHARNGLASFRAFPGFVGGALHRSEDGGRLVQYLQWETEADHHACMNDPRWDDDPSARRFMESVEAGRARLDVRMFSVVASAEGGQV